MTNSEMLKPCSCGRPISDFDVMCGNCRREPLTRPTPGEDKPLDPEDELGDGTEFGVTGEWWGTDKPLGIEEVVARAIEQPFLPHGYELKPHLLKAAARAAIEAYEQTCASTGGQ